jgi:hypothetical protein
MHPMIRIHIQYAALGKSQNPERMDDDVASGSQIFLPMIDRLQNPTMRHAQRWKLDPKIHFLY